MLGIVAVGVVRESQNFSWAFVPIDRVNVPTKFEVRIALPVPEIRGVAKLQTPNLEEVEATGVEVGTVRKSVGKFL